MRTRLDRTIDRVTESCTRLVLSLMKYRRHTGEDKGYDHHVTFARIDEVDIAVGNLNRDLLYHITPDDTFSK